MRKLFSYIRKIRNFVVYWIAASLLPKKDIVLFSSSKNDQFGNISSLELYFQNTNVKFKRIFKDQLKYDPFYFLISLAQAHVLVIDASSPAAQFGLHHKTCLIHCWHAGGAYKKIAFDAKRKNCEDINEEKRIKRIHRCISYFVCSSVETAHVYAKAFRIKLHQMLIFGLPRLDACMQDPIPDPPRSYTILFAPTYRTQEKNSRHLPPMPDAVFLRSVLREQLGEDVRLAFRGHPTAPVPTNLIGWENWSDIPQSEALKCASVLITDYSSIIFDFLLFKRPIVFYVPDMDEYQYCERELYFSPYDVFPQTTCADLHNLIRILTDCRYMKVDYKEFWQEHMSACDGRSTQRLCAFIQEIMRGKTL